MVSGQTFRTPSKHITHYGQRPEFPYPYQTRYPLHYGQRPDFRTPNKHVNHYDQRQDFPYP